MKKVSFDVKGGDFEIITLADVHYGNLQFDETFFTNVLDYIYKNKNVYIILNGDLIEGQTKNAPSSVFDVSEPSIIEQVSWIVEKLKPIAKEKRIISIVGGNHDAYRQVKETGISPTDMIVSLLAQVDDTLPNRYCPDGSGCFIFLRHYYRKSEEKKGGYMSATYTLFHQHSTGGGTTKSGQINKAMKVRDAVPPAMVVITSHVHNPNDIPLVYYEVDYRSQTIKEVNGWNVISNAFMKNFGGYATKNGMKPVSRNVPIIFISTWRRKINLEKRSDEVNKRITIKWRTPEDFE